MFIQATILWATTVLLQRLLDQRASKEKDKSEFSVFEEAFVVLLQQQIQAETMN